jgi:hypothetical protein
MHFYELFTSGALLGLGLARNDVIGLIHGDTTASYRKLSFAGGNFASDAFHWARSMFPFAETHVFIRVWMKAAGEMLIYIVITPAGNERIVLAVIWFVRLKEGRCAAMSRTDQQDAGVHTQYSTRSRTIRRRFDLPHRAHSWVHPAGFRDTGCHNASSDPPAYHQHSQLDRDADDRDSCIRTGQSPEASRTRVRDS